ncbi:hypothetical protein THRCLA_05608 [Thraustotheca clavata]|uniref:Uncharacterized protein n=1 Tax=Thraustotheca clavata TaxID=74557 RepID=A0A1V9ZVD1_9STRA|nr:hypothetical protein THRCLA_05608 [Thraustotheca clavata]
MASSSSVSRPKTVREIRKIMKELNLDDIALHFNSDDDDIDPYDVCDGVSIDAFNAYIGDGEGLRIGLRFISLSSDGHIIIIELPTPVHESTAQVFSTKFLLATGNEDVVSERGSMTAIRPGHLKKEADAAFGPTRSTHGLPPPQGREFWYWATLVVEVGRTQTWRKLEEAAQWWCDYAGVQYILLLKVSGDATQIRYGLYSIVTQGVLPAPEQSGIFRQSTPPACPVNVTFDMRRILAIAPNQLLPNGVNPQAVVNLRQVMDKVINGL